MGIALLLLILVAAGSIWLNNALHSGLPMRSGELQLPGLVAPATVRYDQWGVPFIKAENQHDLALALGWVHANDRMEQMELARLAGQGRLAEVLGADLVATDQKLRRFGIPDLVNQQSRACFLEDGSPASETARWLLAYSSGVNAWLSLHSEDLPPLFQLSGWEPETWLPRDCLAVPALMAFSLSRAFGPSEENRYQHLRRLGVDLFTEMWGEMHLPADILDHPFAEMELNANPDSEAVTEDPGVHGSNNWALSPSRTATGGALLANDPHLGLKLPAVWYQVHLRSPDFEIAGMSFPGSPGVVIGHNADLAWGFTNLMIDDNDVFLERVNEDGSAVLRGDQWLPIEVRDSTIKVKGGADVPFSVKKTDIGYYIDNDPTIGPWSHAWVAHHQISPNPLDAFMALGESKNLDQARAAAAMFCAPGQNLVVAHRNGEIMHTWFGRLPKRRKGDGRLPAMAWNPAYGWDGLWPAGSGLERRSPQSGVLATANNDNRPSWWKQRASGDFALPSRHDRIVEIFESRVDWTVTALDKVHNDTTDLFARELLAAVSASCETLKVSHPALPILRQWDKQMRTTGPSALYRLFRHHYSKTVFGDDENHFNLPAMSNFFRRPQILKAARGELSPVWYDNRNTEDVVETAADCLRLALSAAWDQCRQQWGDNPANWSYGDIHQLMLENPLSSVPVIGSWWDRGPFKVGGSPTSVMAMGGHWKDGREIVDFGPSFRMVCDPLNWDDTTIILPGGQSGHPADPHYDDQLAPYLAGNSKGMPWSEQAITERTSTILSLRP